MSDSFTVDLLDGTQGAVASVGAGMEKLVAAFESGDLASAAMGKSLSALAESLGPVGIAAGVAVIAITGLAAASYELVSATVGIVQQRDALVQTFGALGEGAEGGERTLKMIEQMSLALPYTTDKLAGMATGLMKAGLQGDKLKASLVAVASSAAIMGDGGGAATGLLKRLEMTAEAGGKIKLDRRFLTMMGQAGVFADDLAAKIGVTPEKLGKMNLSAVQLGDAFRAALVDKGKGSLEALGMTWDSISGKIHDGVASMFEGLAPEVHELMGAVQSLFGEFFRGSSTTKGSMGAVHDVMHSLITTATDFTTAIHLGLLNVEIAWLKVQIAMHKGQASFQFGPLIGSLALLGSGIGVVVGWLEQLADWASKNQSIMLGLEVVFGAVAIAIGVAVAGVALFIGGAVALAAIVVGAVAGAIGIVWQIIKGLGEGLGELAFIAVDAAGKFITGLVTGIKSGMSTVVHAVENLGEGIASGIKGALGIHSPSTVAVDIMQNVTTTMAGTADAGVGQVKQAGRRLGTGAAEGIQGGVGAAGANGAAGRDARDGVTVHIHPGAIVLHGGGGADLLALTEEAVDDIFERAALRAGLA